METCHSKSVEELRAIYVGFLRISAHLNRLDLVQFFIAEMKNDIAEGFLSMDDFVEITNVTGGCLPT